MDKKMASDIRLCCLYAKYLRDRCGFSMESYDRAVILYDTLIKIEERLKNEKKIQSRKETY